ncbi:unnamed protein product [Aphanomyces euteiches]
MHGVMPVPAPATLRLFMGIPVAPAPNGAVGELVTPTGASLMKALAKTFGQPPPFLPTASGSGAGTKDFPNHANIVRVVIGDAIEPSASVPNASWRPMLPRERQLDASGENVIVLETNLDDMNPQMKKNRPATLLSVLCHHQKVDELSQILFDETTTLGIRRQTMNRLVLRREKINVATPYGIASAKIGYMDDRVVNVQPEYEDCKALALSQNVPLKVVLAKVSSLAFEQGKSVSSARWLARQQNDHIVKQAKREGLRSRAAIKLRELNAKFKLIRKGNVVIDLGAAPGGWTQIAIEECSKNDSSSDKRVNVIAVDILPFDAFPGVGVVIGDFRRPDIREKITELMDGRQADVVLSDMAPSFSGVAFRDSEEQLRLCQNALRMAQLYLKPGGKFVAKILRSPAGDQFRAEMKPFFNEVKTFKPDSSRQESVEIFAIGLGFQKPPSPEK